MVATNQGDVVSETPEEESKHLWSSLLKDVTNSGIGKLPQKKGLVILGDNGVGKTALLCRINRELIGHKCPGLEYHYIDVKDEVRCDQTKLSAFILGGDVAYVPLLKFVLDKKNFGDRVAVITVSMDSPWDIPAQLEKWARILDDYINKLEISKEEMGEFKQNLIRQFREYTDPDTLLLKAVGGVSSGQMPATTEGTAKSVVSQTISKPTPANSLHPAKAALFDLSIKVPEGAKLADTDNVDVDGEAVANAEKRAAASKAVRELPITQGALVNNLGIPLIVVVTKVDVMDTMAKENRISDERFDILQLHIRKFCLSYGAALFYVSAKDAKNCDLLSKYLQHRIYGFPFTQKAYVVEKDCIFIPMGWDTPKKMAILEENLLIHRFGDGFETVFPRPDPHASSGIKQETEVVAVSEQLFLARLFKALQRDSDQKGPAGDVVGTAPSLLNDTPLDASSGPVGSRPSSGSPRTTALHDRTSAPGPVGEVARGGFSEKVLANFFNNLLSKSPSNRHTPNTSANTAADSMPGDREDLSSQDMQSVLERIVPPPTDTTPSKDGSPNTGPTPDAVNGETASERP